SYISLPLLQSVLYSRFFSELSGQLVLYFFFQAEDRIRHRNVTGVQTCALPISELFHVLASPLKIGSVLCLFGIAVLAFIAVERVVFNTQLQFVFICV